MTTFITRCLNCGAVYEIRTDYDVNCCPACKSLNIVKTIENKTNSDSTKLKE